MKSNGVILLYSLAYYLQFTEQQNLTSSTINTSSSNAPGSRRAGHRDANILSALQQLQSQLSALEGEGQRQATRLQELNRIAARLETQRQDLLGVLDRSEARIAQRLDDIKGDVRKVLTLQEVVRDDVDKVQQNQLLNKVWLQDQLRQIHIQNTDGNVRTLPDSSLLSGGGDIQSSIQVLQTTLHSLRRMADTVKQNLAVLQKNVTTLANNTQKILDHQNTVLPSKAYLLSSLQSILAETKDRQIYVGCTNELRSREPEEALPGDCKDVKDQIQNLTGIYRIQPAYARSPIFAYCDMDTDNGGWTVIQRRKDGSVDFLRDWNEYKHGFGNVAGEFWLGNENLHIITHQRLYELRVDLLDFEDGRAFTVYKGFAVGNEQEKYMLKLLGPLSAGDAGDGLTYHASIPFSTIDMDNDRWEGGSCAQEHTGGWWYNQCDASNLNGQYLGGLTPQEYKGVYWHEWQGPNYSLKYTTMMIRPIAYNTISTDILETTTPSSDPKEVIDLDTYENNNEEPLNNVF